MRIPLCLQYSGIVLFAALVLASCKKDDDGGGGTVNQKPKVGTVWVYSYYTYHQNGGIATSKTITWKAIAQETIGGEQWLRVNEQGVDTTVYLLRERSNGLYQYKNNSAQLFCKNPANLNETYTSFYRDTTLTFRVANAAFTLPTNIGDIKANYYEALRNGNLTDEFWFNENAWIVRQQSYRKPALGSYYKQSAHFIQSVVY
jgi:hypothetical protein